MQSTYLDFERPLEELDRAIEAARVRKSPVEEIAGIEARERDLERQLYGDLSPWYRVQLSRHPDRPQTLDYAGQIFDEFTELHGDRGFADDPSIVGGFARFEGRAVMLVGHQRGRTTQ
jgi:acetyl-CoA carboxylase carboxyl transferase subunit alpha